MGVKLVRLPFIFVFPTKVCLSRLGLPRSARERPIDSNGTSTVLLPINIPLVQANTYTMNVTIFGANTGILQRFRQDIEVFPFHNMTLNINNLTMTVGNQATLKLHLENHGNVPESVLISFGGNGTEFGNFTTTRIMIPALGWGYDIIVNLSIPLDWVGIEADYSIIVSLQVSSMGISVNTTLLAQLHIQGGFEAIVNYANSLLGNSTRDICVKWLLHTALQAWSNGKGKEAIACVIAAKQFLYDRHDVRGILFIAVDKIVNSTIGTIVGQAIESGLRQVDLISWEIAAIEVDALQLRLYCEGNVSDASLNVLKCTLTIAPLEAWVEAQMNVISDEQYNLVTMLTPTLVQNLVP